MLDLGPDTGLALLDFVHECVDWNVCFIEMFALARKHGHLPAHAVHCVESFVGTLITRIGKDDGFLPVQQTIAFGDIGHMAGRAAHRMHQPRVGIHADMGLHPKVPLVALLARMHLRVALAVLVLRRTRRRHQSRIHCAALLEQQALAAQQIIDCRQDAIGQFVVSSRWRNRRMVLSSGRRTNSSSRANSRYSGTSKKASSIAGSDGLNRCCRKCVRSIVSSAKGRCPVRPSG